VKKQREGIAYPPSVIPAKGAKRLPVRDPLSGAAGFKVRDAGVEARHDESRAAPDDVAANGSLLSLASLARPG
jgi:hypothetical protein